MRDVKDCDIQVRDTVLFRQPKQERPSTPYHPTPLIFPTKHHSTLTAESTDPKMTCNSSHFKKLLVNDSNTFRTSQFLEGETVHIDTESSPCSSTARTVVEHSVVKDFTQDYVSPCSSSFCLVKFCCIVFVVTVTYFMIFLPLIVWFSSTVGKKKCSV